MNKSSFSGPNTAATAARLTPGDALGASLPRRTCLRNDTFPV
jgi:hypothetical protein